MRPIKKQSRKTTGKQLTQPKGQHRPMAMLSKAEARLQSLRWVKDLVILNHRAWSARNANATVQDLAERLELALQQCQRIITRSCDYPYIPEPLAPELAEWDNNAEECTFSYREPQLEDMLAFVEELAEKTGYNFRVSELKGWQPK